jgi:hypothetical protein
MLSGGTSRVFSTNLLIGDVLSQKTTISILKMFYSEKFRKKSRSFFISRFQMLLCFVVCMYGFTIGYFGLERI